MPTAVLGGGTRRTFICPGGTKCANYIASREVFSFKTSDKKHYVRGVKGHAKRCVATEQRLEEFLNAPWTQYVHSRNNPNMPPVEWMSTNRLIPSLTRTSEGLFTGPVSADMKFVELYTLLQPEFQNWIDAQVGLIDFLNGLETHHEVTAVLDNLREAYDRDPETNVCVDSMDDDELALTPLIPPTPEAKECEPKNNKNTKAAAAPPAPASAKQTQGDDLFVQLFGEGIDQSDPKNKFPCPAGCRNRIGIPIFCRSIGKLLTHLRDCHPKIRIGVMFSGLPKAIAAFDEDDQGGIAVVQPAFGELTSDKDLFILKDEEENDWDDDDEDEA